MEKFHEYFSLVNHPYRTYALLIVLAFGGSVVGNVLANWLFK